MQRYCHGCKLWYHIECLEPLPPGIPTMVKSSTDIRALTHSHRKRIQDILRIPIQRGGNHGIVGNGQAVLLVWKIYQSIKDHKSSISAEMWTQCNDAHNSLRSEIDGDKVYYGCLTCNSKRKYYYFL